MQTLFRLGAASVLLAAAPFVSAQPAVVFRGGPGLAYSAADGGKVAVSGLAGVAVKGWAAGVHAEHAEELAFFTRPAEATTALAALVGREWRPAAERGYIVLWAGPAYVQTVRRGETIGSSGWLGSEYERIEGADLGAVVRVSMSAFPIRAFPVGLSVDAGLTTSQAGAELSGGLGLAVRFGD